MKYLLTNAEMREADGYTMRETPSLTLMERAGIALADEVDFLKKTGEILVVCGGGNNGGDGFVCARILKERGREVTLVCYAEKYSTDCGENKRRWQAVGGEIYTEIPKKEYAVIVDCLYGTGFHGSLQERDAQTVERMCVIRKEGAKVLSADIPSGVNGDNGRVQGLAVRADVTLCIGEVKMGAVLNDGIDYVGKIKRADIGIALPKPSYSLWIDGEEVSKLLPRRRRNSHKGSYGKAAIVAGSEEYTGAAYLSMAAGRAALACLRSGAGYTALFLPKALLPAFVLKMPEALLKKTNDGGRYAFNEENMRELLGYSSVAFGMGMGVSKEVFQGARWLLANFTGKLILDADGLNSLAKYGENTLPSLFANKKCEVVLTPHIKEFSRLSGRSVEEILKGGVAIAKEYASANGVIVLLKNAVSVITDGERVFVNTSGNAGQAKGGSGDVLSGVLAGLTAGGAPLLHATIVGAYLTGKAAEIAVKEVGEYSLLASDVLENLGKAFLSLTENANENGGGE